MITCFQERPPRPGPRPNGTVGAPGPFHLGSGPRPGVARSSSTGNRENLGSAWLLLIQAARPSHSFRKRGVAGGPAQGRRGEAGRSRQGKATSAGGESAGGRSLELTATAGGRWTGTPRRGPRAFPTSATLHVRLPLLRSPRGRLSFPCPIYHK